MEKRSGIWYVQCLFLPQQAATTPEGKPMLKFRIVSHSHCLPYSVTCIDGSCSFLNVPTLIQSGFFVGSGSLVPEDAEFGFVLQSESSLLVFNTNGLFYLIRKNSRSSWWGTVG